MQEMQETQVRSLGGKGPLEEEEMATDSSILAWRGSPWTEEPDGLQPMGSQLNQVSKHTHMLEGPEQNLAQVRAETRQPLGPASLSFSL